MNHQRAKQNLWKAVQEASKPGVSAVWLKCWGRHGGAPALSLLAHSLYQKE